MYNLFSKLKNRFARKKPGFLAKLVLPDKPVVIDVGAYKGEFTAEILEHFSTSQVICFEPSEVAFGKLSHRFSGNKNVRVINKAVGSRDEIAKLYINDFDETNSLLQSNTINEQLDNLTRNIDIENTQVVTLDVFCRENNCIKVDLLKIDAQGFSYEVLQGARQLLEDGLVKYIYAELEFLPIYEGQKLFHDVDSLLNEFGFRRTEIFNENFLEDGRRAWCDVLYTYDPLHAGNITSIAQFAGVPSYSQCGEDLIMRYIFGLKNIFQPSYIDIGAHHPYRLNNTVLFYLAGSRGINIEANPSLIKSFVKLRPDDINLNIGVAGVSGSLTFFEMDDPALSTFSKQDADNYVIYGKKITHSYPVQVFPLKNILEQHFEGRFPDILSIDIEGMELEILSAIDFSVSRPKVICVETVTFHPGGRGIRRNELRELLVSNGYFEYAHTYLNSIMVDLKFWEKAAG